MESLGFIIDLIKGKGKCRLTMHIHDLTLEETNLLEERLGKGFSRSDAEFPKYSPPYESTYFYGRQVLGYEAIHITTYRDTIKQERKEVNK